MFGYVNVSYDELTEAQKRRYDCVYCGICRCIRSQSRQLARLCLSYDMAFLALLLMSLYEPEERSGGSACLLHPIRKRGWVENEYIRYAADMNVALAYYNFLDDWEDDRNGAARVAASLLKDSLEAITLRYPRQCDAIRRCIGSLRALEKANCPNPDEAAGCFGDLMAELFVYRQDLWEPYLRQMGRSLGRFIYLADAVNDLPSDKRKNKYNPFLAAGLEAQRQTLEQYLVLDMAQCTQSFQKLPLVQDKEILDNILYSGIWVEYRRRNGNDRRSL
jgi:hypothetical protein